MGTENLQKLSNKRSNKTIYFTDYSIEKFKPTIETKRVKVGFPRNSITNCQLPGSFPRKFLKMNAILP